jgi:hypothetical protein
VRLDWLGLGRSLVPDGALRHRPTKRRGPRLWQASCLAHPLRVAGSSSAAASAQRTTGKPYRACVGDSCSIIAMAPALALVPIHGDYRQRGDKAD